jgi:hypothetical protein
VTTPTHLLPIPPTSAADRVPLRLQLDQPTGGGALDGSWWPQSRDLSLELADLVDNFPSALGEVHRVVISRPDLGHGAASSAGSTRARQGWLLPSRGQPPVVAVDVDAQHVSAVSDRPRRFLTIADADPSRDSQPTARCNRHRR